jgi:hypothetical protein
MCKLNPDELVWSHVKRTGVARTALRKGESLKDEIEVQLARIKTAPKLVRSFLRAPECPLYYRAMSKASSRAPCVNQKVPPCAR